MFAIEVIPIVKGILKEKLTYFSNKEIPLGAIVEIPLRKKTAKALVSGKTSILEIKSQLKQADFSVKKIGTVKVKNFLPTEFIESAEETAEFFASSTGAILNNLIPKQVIEKSDKLKTESPEKRHNVNRHEKLVIQAGEEERFSTYRNLIREEFAKNLSVLFIAPTLEEINRSKKILEKGIEDFVFCFNSGMSPKELEDKWNRAVALKHPILLISTPQFINFPRSDFSTIIIERENSSAYKDIRRPYIDVRTFAEIFAKKLGVKLVFGDFFLRTETIWRQENLDFSELTPIKFRTVSSAREELADLTGNKNKDGDFYPFSEKMLETLEFAQKNKEKVFIFGARKGLSPLLTCLDCGKSVECQNCASPITLHDEVGKRKMICHKCGFKKDAIDKCGNCGGWRIRGLGIGLESIEKEIEKLYPKTKVWRLDKEIARTANQANKIIAAYLKSDDGILVGSEMALFYLDEKVDHVISATIDSLFSIPDFRINERVFSLLLRLKTKAEKSFLVQTRLPDLSLWQNLLSGNLIDFYRNELEARRKLDYPPFSLFIKIIIQSTQKETAEREAEKIKSDLSEYQSIAYPAFIPKTKGRYVMNILLKLDRDKWPNKELLEKLRALPPKFSIKVDPENIL